MKQYLTGLIVVIALLSLAMPSTALAAMAVSSDGEELAIEEIKAAGEGADSTPFRGTGGIEKAGLAAEGAITEGGPSTSELMKLKPVTAEIGVESVLGFDGRVQTYTKAYPQRAVALVTFEAGRCTGWFIGKDTVVTSGHCVHSGGSRGRWYSRTSYKVYPGRDKSKKPYGYCRAKQLWSNTSWTGSARDDRDWGLIKLSCTTGNRTGWFGYLSTGSLKNEPVRISGYPGDKPLTQWESSDKVRVSQTRRLFYKADTIGGMSGSPIWHDYVKLRYNGPYGMGVHSYGTYNGGYYKIYNHGPKIDSFTFNTFKMVKNLP